MCGMWDCPCGVCGPAGTAQQCLASPVMAVAAVRQQGYYLGGRNATGVVDCLADGPAPLPPKGCGVKALSSSH